MSIKKKINKLAHKIHTLMDGKFEPPEKENNTDEDFLKKRYQNEMDLFAKMGGKITHLWPILTDYKEQAGIASGHYFHQDLLVASMIYENQPRRHIDIGSRIDGFVAHVATFRKIEVLDVRALQDTGHPNISFLKSDLMREEENEPEKSDSISCLHALEHFGLGRYGDPLDPDGHLKGFRNIAKMLEPGGFLYVSIPIGASNEVHFNAHRVFDPLEILNWLGPNNEISLSRFDYVDDLGNLHRDFDLHKNRPTVVYGCGIYTFKRS